jgi:GMP synthase (glutamine-hydrolysing)
MFYPEKFVREQVPHLSRMIGEEKAVIPASGGVGSIVSAVLTHRAVNDRAIIVFIDDGMQSGEAGDMMHFYATQNMNTKLVDAAHEFSGALNGIDEPTEQRRTYRDTYYAILERILREEKAQYLVQGTTATNIMKTEEGVELHDDVLEQVGIRVIDSRKNGVTVIEPLKKLNRHEVLKVAQHLELPPELSLRKSFPAVLSVIREALMQ